jgi:hypothetical protein
MISAKRRAARKAVEYLTEEWKRKCKVFGSKEIEG